VVATPGDTQATLNFTAPANGGSAITGYSASCIPGPVTASSATTSINVTGLSNGTNYSCTVTATNAVGPGPASSPVSVRPAALPGAPIITSTVAGDAQASIFFTPPASNGGAPISGYSASCGVGGAAPFTTASGAFSPITVASLLNGSTYQCTVSATNVSGTGLPSVAASVTPTNAPTLTLLFAASRKTHGAAGACDIVIDAQQTVTQSVTVEPRIAGAAHTVYFRFNAAVLNAGSVATFDSLGGAIGSPSSVAAGNDVVVTLSGIPDKSRVRIALTGVNGGTDVEASMGFLVADISDSRSVSSADISGVKARQGQTLDPSNCRFDLNTSGTISAQDTSVVKSRAGATLP
jgi:hypothetical protein